METIDDAAFERRAQPPTLGMHEIHVWSLQLDAAADARTRSAAIDAARARLLGVYASVSGNPLIERGAHGKPYAPALDGLEFNLSHAGHHALLAFARGQPLGVDLERCDRRPPPAELARRYFTRAEADALERVPEELRQRCFLQLWTQKEAVLKALGRGLSFGLDRLAFTIGDGAVGHLREIAAEGGAVEQWQLRRLRPGPGLIGALAWHGADRAVRAFALVP